MTAKMAALQASLLLVLAAACGLSAAESTATCELVVDVVYPTVAGGSPYPVCSSHCDSDQSGIWYQGVAFRRYSALRDEYQLMVAADYQHGDLVSCSLVPYKTTNQLLEEAAARKAAEADCLGSTTDGKSSDLPVTATDSPVHVVADSNTGALAVEPTTPEPATTVPTTSEPTTPEPTTPEPTTQEPITPESTTPEPTTPESTTPESTTPESTTPEPTTPESTTPESTTPEPTTPEPTNPEPTTPEPTTPEPTTAEPTTPEPTTPEQTTPEPATQEPTTQEPTTLEPTTPETTTLEPTTPESTTPESTTPEPTTPEPTTSEPTTPEPTTPEPTTTTTTPTTTTTTTPVPTTLKIIPTTTPTTTPTTIPTTTPTTTTKTIPTTTTPKPIVYTCPSGHHKYKDASCYMVPSHTDIWTNAYSYCKDRGYSLARIESADEQKFVAGLISDDIWIDLNDRGTEGKFLFTDGRSTSFTFWDSGEPNDYMWKTEDCVEMRRDSDYRWNDKDCDYMRRFVCEKPTTLL